MPASISRNRALLELVFAASLWGFGFVATRWCLDTMQPLWLNFYRFILSFILGLPFAIRLGQGSTARLQIELFRAWKPGFWIAATSVLQTYGLQYTTVTKSGFITCLYVVFVPILGKVFFRQATSLVHCAFVAIALIGAALICELDSIQPNLGDWLTLACAVTAAMQILEVGKLSVTSHSAFLFALGQSLMAALFIAPVALFAEPFPALVFAPQVVAGLLGLTVGSTLLAFAIQIRGQRVLSPPVVSLLFLLESPFAAYFAGLFFHETIRFGQTIGAVTILVAAGGSILWDRRRSAPQSA